MSRTFFGRGRFNPTGRVEEGAYRDEVQVNPVVSVAFFCRRVPGVLRARLTMLLQIVVLSVRQAALLNILYYTEGGSYLAG